MKTIATVAQSVENFYDITTLSGITYSSLRLFSVFEIWLCICSLNKIPVLSQDIINNANWLSEHEAST